MVDLSGHDPTLKNLLRDDSLIEIPFNCKVERTFRRAGMKVKLICHSQWSGESGVASVEFRLKGVVNRADRRIIVRRITDDSRPTVLHWGETDETGVMTTRLKPGRYRVASSVNDL